MEAARGDRDGAAAAFERALEHVEPLDGRTTARTSQLAHGQFLRREGRRRSAADLLTAAADTFAALGARPALERTERELGGLRPAAVARAAPGS